MYGRGDVRGLVSDGNDRQRIRACESHRYGGGAYGNADFYLSGSGGHKMEKHSAAEFSDMEGM